MKNSSASSGWARLSGRSHPDEQSPRAEHELEVLFTIASDGLVLYDATGEIRLTNEALWRLLEVAAEERQHVRDCYAIGRLILQRMQARRPWRAPWELWKGNGPESEPLELAGGWILERVVQPVLDEHGRPRRWLERYRRQRLEAERAIRWQQVEKMVAIGQMVAGVVHDLNNPLTAILGHAQLVEESVHDPAARADLDRIVQEATRAVGLIRSLLNMVRAGRAERTWVDVNELVGQASQLCAYELKRARIHFECDLAPTLPRVFAHAGQMQQAILNLLLNSLQAISASGVGDRIIVRTRHDAERVFLQVEDNGPGIPVELHERIFEPFFTTKPPGMGTGLGLAVVSGIVREHGGEVLLASHPGAGATFTLLLPMRCSDVPPAPSAQSDSPTVAATPASTTHAA